jgi:transcriptional regulator with XRE-family HTH domain
LLRIFVNFCPRSFGTFAKPHKPTRNPSFAKEPDFTHPLLIRIFNKSFIFANICQDTNFIILGTQFGEQIREFRTNNNLLLRQVAALLDVDASILSKIELGERKAKKEQVLQLAEIYKTGADELLTLWLSDQLYDVAKDEDVGLKAIRMTEEKIKHEKPKGK